MKASEIRQRFVEYFEKNGHSAVRSASLIPHNDPTLYFVNAGMVPFKDVFTGNEARDYTRATTVQKCLRVSGKHNDLENVGRTPRHHTFFEMLGNFSFGDYFKEDAIPFAWDLLTNELGIDAERLWVTVFEEDDEAYTIWRDKVGVPEARIQRLGAKDNFWSMGPTGPCGPCSEIFYDHGEAIDPGNLGGPATESDRYVEIWNLVFMQFEQHADGTRTDLPKPSIDTGSGLERVAAVMQGVTSNYDTDLLQPLIQTIAKASGIAYGQAGESDTAMRVIADHARAAAFLIGDGVMPSNEGRGYVLRRVMRRAIRFGLKLGFEQESFFHLASQAVVDTFGEAYPELATRSAFIDEVVRSEETRFRSTLARGMKLIEAEVAKAGEGGTIDGDTAFDLYQTFGFPKDLTVLIAEEHGVSVDEEGYTAALEAEKARGRAGWKGSGEEAISGLWFQIAEQSGATNFLGYDRDVDVATVIGAVRVTTDDDGDHHELVERLAEGERGVLVLDRTPFYAESGGQVGDTGVISAGENTAAVSDTTKASGLFLHHVAVSGGSFAAGDGVQASVDGARRDQTRRNHTATHLLHAVLRSVLGEHVTQKGSLVGPERLRFDFSHLKPMTAEEVAQVEDEVNAQVLSNAGLNTKVMDLDAAKEAGAMALFGEKYDDDVRVVSVPGYSVELCGGTHVTATGDIGLFRITTETGIAAGVRRIEAQTGLGSLRVAREQAQLLDSAAAALKTGADNLTGAITKLQDERRQLAKELEALKREIAAAAAGDLVSGAHDIGGIKVLAAEYDGDLKEQADRLREQLGSALVVLLGRGGNGVKLVAAATKDVAGSRVHAGKIIQAIAPMVGGRGGGRPDLAQGGGSDPSGIAAALERAIEVATEQLS
ncbi:MAG: alanine--tRNA ligase [Proteobacteria bacterium]|nr:alanine--tRNA ligase [Pseudomonadota bacterium]